MAYGALLWVLIALASISLSANHPEWALGLAGTGGLGLGVYLWCRARTRMMVLPPDPCPDSAPARLCRLELPLLLPALAILLFANRFPPALWFVALGWLLLLESTCAVARRRPARSRAGRDPAALPFLLLLLPSLASLHAAADLRLSASAVCMLVAGLALAHALARGLDTGQKLYWAFLIFLVLGAGVALSAFLFMPVPGAKVPLLGTMLRRLPGAAAEHLNPNYLGGALALCVPVALWAVVPGRTGRRWIGVLAAVTGTGLLLTQSRGALLGTGVALVLTGACWSRRVRWALPVLAVTMGLLAYALGPEALLDPVAGTGMQRGLAARQELWQRAVYIAQDFPFTGIGLRSFPEVVDLLYPLLLMEPGARMPHPHNLFLEVVASLGFAGLVAFCAVLGAWGGMLGEVLVRTGRDPALRSGKFMALGLAGGMLAHLLYGLTDAIALGEKAGVLFWAVVGLGGALWQQVRRQTGLPLDKTGAVLH